MAEKLNFVEEEELPIQSTFEWDRPFCYREGKLFFPKIAFGDKAAREGYNCIVLELDGRVTSSLDWSEALNVAEEAIQKGLNILWFLNLGLFSELPLDLYHPSQFQTLSLAVEHFIKKVWGSYSSNSLGVCLYQGNMDFSTSFQWSEKQLANLQEWLEESFETPKMFHQVSFNEIRHQDIPNEVLSLYACDVGMDYIGMLAQTIPDNVECFVLLDAQDVPSALTQARMLVSERCDRLHFVVKNSLLPEQSVSWDKQEAPFGFFGAGNDTAFQKEKFTIGLCIPEISMVDSKYYAGLEEAIHFLNEKKYGFRIVSEANLTAEWDGLDILIVNESGLSQYGLRKLQGFSAAGGRILSTEKIFELQNEIELVSQ